MIATRLLSEVKTIPLTPSFIVPRSSLGLIVLLAIVAHD
jgi:hypothetical protein